MGPLKENYEILHLLIWEDVCNIHVHCKTKLCMCIHDRNMWKSIYENINSNYLQLKDDAWEFFLLFLFFLYYLCLH